MILSLCLFCCILYFFLRFKDTPKNRTVFISTVTVVLILVSGLRHPDVGNDTANYLRNFDEVSCQTWAEVLGGFIDAYFNPSSDTGKDPGLLIYNKILGMFFSSHILYLIVSAALLLIPLAVFLRKYSFSLNSLLFAYLFFISIYYVYLPNSALRQSIALGILLCVFNSLIRNRKLLFVVMVLIASIFHKSALLAILMLMPNIIRNEKIVYWAGMPLLAFMFMEYSLVGTFLASQSDIYSMYANDYYAYGQSRPFIILLFFTGLYLFGLIILNRYLDKGRVTELSKYAICGTVFTVVFSPLILLDPSLIRITAYFIIWFMLFIPQIIKLSGKTMSPIIYVFCILLFLYKAYKSGGQYLFIWEL